MQLGKYYRLPKVLLTEQYQELSMDGALLYAVLLDRIELSKINATNNAWTTAQGEVYVHFSLEEMQRILRRGHDKTTRVCRELEYYRLIKRIRVGCGKAYRIVVYPPKLNSEENAYHNATLLNYRSDNSAGNNTELTVLTDINITDPVQQAIVTDWDIKESYDTLYAMYPANHRGDYEQGLVIYRKLVLTLVQATRVQDSLAVWLKSAEWNREGGRYIPLLANYLSRKYVDKQPLAVKPSFWGSGELGQEEIEAIHKMMSK